MTYSRNFLAAQRRYDMAEPDCSVDPVEALMEEVASDFQELSDIASTHFNPTDKLIALYMTLGERSSQEQLAEFLMEFGKSMEHGIRASAELLAQDRG